MRDIHAFAAAMAACGVGWAMPCAGASVGRPEPEPHSAPAACAQARDPEAPVGPQPEDDGGA